MISVKRGGIKYYFWVFSMTAWDWTPVSRAIDEYLTHEANLNIYTYFFMFFLSLFFPHTFITTIYT